MGSFVFKYFQKQYIDVGLKIYISMYIYILYISLQYIYTHTTIYICIYIYI